MAAIEDLDVGALHRLLIADVVEPAEEVSRRLALWEKFPDNWREMFGKTSPDEKISNSIVFSALFLPENSTVADKVRRIAYSSKVFPFWHKTYGLLTAEPKSNRVANMILLFDLDDRWMYPQFYFYSIQAACRVGDAGLVQRVLDQFQMESLPDTLADRSKEPYLAEDPAVEYPDTVTMNPFWVATTLEALDVLLADPRLNPGMLDNEAAIKLGINPNRGELFEMFAEDPRVWMDDHVAREIISKKKGNLKTLHRPALMFCMEFLKSSGSRIVEGKAQARPLSAYDRSVWRKGRDAAAVGIRWLDNANREASERIAVFDHLERDHGVTADRYIKIAARQGDLAFVDHLLSRPDPPEAESCEQALANAAKGGHIEIVERLLSVPEVDPAADNNAAVRAASGAGETQVVALLMADPRVNKKAREWRAARSARKSELPGYPSAPPPSYFESK
jgi:hypothetical protein